MNYNFIKLYSVVFLIPYDINLEIYQIENESGTFFKD